MLPRKSLSFLLSLAALSLFALPAAASSSGPPLPRQTNRTAGFTPPIGSLSATPAFLRPRDTVRLSLPANGTVLAGVPCTFTLVFLSATGGTRPTLDIATVPGPALQGNGSYAYATSWTVPCAFAQLGRVRFVAGITTAAVSASSQTDADIGADDGRCDQAQATGGPVGGARPTGGAGGGAATTTTRPSGAVKAFAGSGCALAGSLLLRGFVGIL